MIQYSTARHREKNRKLYSVDSTSSSVDSTSSSVDSTSSSVDSTSTSSVDCLHVRVLKSKTSVVMKQTTESTRIMPVMAHSTYG